MAQQESIIKLKGKIGDLTFFKTKTGYQARQATGVSADRVATDPKFQRTRENNAEFATGGVAAKKLRQALRTMIMLTNDAKMSQRLFSRMMRVVRADAENIRGERKVLAENLSLLNKFSFNTAALLSNTVFVERKPVIDREAGSVQMNLQGYIPAIAIVAPQGATHFQFNLGAAAIDFDSDELDGLSMAQSEASLAKAIQAESQELTVTLPTNSTLPIFVLFGISFFQEVNAVLYPLNNGAYNAIEIIQIDLP